MAKLEKLTRSQLIDIIHRKDNKAAEQRNIIAEQADYIRRLENKQNDYITEVNSTYRENLQLKANVTKEIRKNVCIVIIFIILVLIIIGVCHSYK